MGLSQEEIAKLLKDDKPTITVVHRAVPPEQFGPLRWVDTEHRCATRGCSSSTFCKVLGIPRCMKHALQILNDMLTLEDVPGQL